MANNKNWDEKFYRENPFMAFGSMMNAYSRINEGDGKDVEEFLEDAEKVFDKALKFTRKSYHYSKAEDEIKKKFYEPKEND